MKRRRESLDYLLRIESWEALVLELDNTGSNLCKLRAKLLRSLCLHFCI